MNRIKTKFDYLPRSEDQEGNFGPSETVQGDALSIAEMFNRLAQGLPVTRKNGEYQDEVEFDDEDHEKCAREDKLEQARIWQETEERKMILEEDFKKRSKASKKRKEVVDSLPVADAPEVQPEAGNDEDSE